MRETLIVFLALVLLILLFTWNEDRECQPADEYDFCETDRESRQF